MFDWDDVKLENPAIALKEWHDKMIESGFKGINIVVGGRGAGRSYFMNKETLEYAQEQLKDLRRRELMSREHRKEKIKAVSAVMIDSILNGEPYYEIKYRKPGSMEYSVGYGSYYKELVEKWLEEEFEIVSESGENFLEDRIAFEYDFCSKRCPDIYSCNHRYVAAQCEPLFEALKENGFIEDAKCNETYDKIVKQMDGKKLSEMRPVELYNVCICAGMDVELGHDRKYYIEKMLDTGYNPEVTGEEKVIQFPVDMDGMQKNILVALLNARRECTDQNMLTARGCVAIIDALFYLVRGVDE